MSQSDAGVRAQVADGPAPCGARQAPGVPHENRFAASGLPTGALTRMVRLPGSGKTALISAAVATSFRRNSCGATSQAAGAR